MTGDEKPDHANGWQRYARTFLLVSSVVLAVGALINLFRPTFPFFAPYVWAAIACLITAFVLGMYLSIWHQARGLQQITAAFLVVGAYLILLFASNATSLVYHFKAVNAEGYDKPLTFPMALGFISLVAVLELFLLIWLLRFCWDAQVRLNIMQTILLARLEVDLTKERRKYFATGAWLKVRTRRLELLRIIAPDDLSYLTPGPPTIKVD